MALRIISADERLSAAENKTSFAIFGPPGIGKTTLLKTLPEHDTVCLDLEAGLKSVQDWCQRRRKNQPRGRRNSLPPRVS
jgi:replication-associated recombination protein RarA